MPAVCCLITRGDSLLLGQRAVEPCLGHWTLPGGFVELGETTEEAAGAFLGDATHILSPRKAAGKK